MDMKPEVVVVPVADVDRAKAFYQQLGWREDADFATSADFRVVQMTPPGSPCSVILGTGITSAAPGSTQGLQLAVDDIDAARTELADHGAPVSEVLHDAGGVFHHASFLSLSDPDGNTWFVQEVTIRLPGRPSQPTSVATA